MSVSPWTSAGLRGAWNASWVPHVAPPTASHPGLGPIGSRRVQGGISASPPSQRLICIQSSTAQSVMCPTGTEPSPAGLAAPPRLSLHPGAGCAPRGLQPQQAPHQTCDLGHFSPSPPDHLVTQKTRGPDLTHDRPSLLLGATIVGTQGASEE